MKISKETREAWRKLANSGYSFSFEEFTIILDYIDELEKENQKLSNILSWIESPERMGR